MNAILNSTPAAPAARNEYNALTVVPLFARALMQAAEAAGCWETGIAANRRRTRGEAINADLYGCDEAQSLIIVQVRQCRFRKGRFPKVRKDYYLVGRTESGAVFAHAVESPARSKIAMSTPEMTVAWTLARIWGCAIEDLPHIERQGDVAFVPVRAIPAAAMPIPEGEAVFIRDSHRLSGPVYRTQDGTLYAKRGAVLKHEKGEHKRVKAREGTYRVVPGYRAAVWGFSRPTAD